MIQIELEASVAGLTDADLEAIGDILDVYRAAITYANRTGVLFLSATVERMTMFIGLDASLRGILSERDRYPTVMAYKVTSPA